MLKFLWNNAARRTSVAAKVQMILTLLLTASVLVAGVMYAENIEMFLNELLSGDSTQKVDIGMSRVVIGTIGIAALMLAFGWIIALTVQGSAVVAEKRLTKQWGLWRVFLDNAPAKLRRVASVGMYLTIGLAALLVLGGFIKLFNVELLIALVLMAAGVVLFLVGWMLMLNLQALAIAGGAGSRYDFFLRNAGERVQLLASVVMIAELAVGVCSLVTSVVQNGPLWGILVGTGAIVASLFTGWVNALTFQSLGDASEGVNLVRPRWMEFLLGKAGKKLNVVTMACMVIVPVCAIVLLVVAAVMAWPLLTNVQEEAETLSSVLAWAALLPLAGALFHAMVWLLCLLPMKCLAEAGARATIPMWCWQCTCGTSNKLREADCASCGTKKPVCPRCGAVQVLRGAMYCHKCRSCVRQ